MAFARSRELDNRRLKRECNASIRMVSIRMVPITVAELNAFTARTGGDPLDHLCRTR